MIQKNGKEPKVMILRQIGVFLIAFSLFIGICAGADENIYKILIIGNVKVEDGVIRGAIKSREGGLFSLEKVRGDLRSIFSLGYFTDVQIDIKSAPQGKEVIFIVAEKPSVKEVIIKGNQKVKQEDIREKVTVKTRTILNLEKVKESLEQIRKLYFSKGYYGVKVQYKIDYLETNEAVVTFTISEGPKGYVKKIIFKGNKKIKSSQLKKGMSTKEKTLLSWLTKTGTLDEDALANDIQLINAYYFDHGYLEAKVSEPKVDFSNSKKIRIEIGITEGPQYHIGEIDFNGDILTTKEDLFKKIALKRGDVFSNTAIRKDISSLTEIYANQGYAYVEIDPQTLMDKKNLLVNLTFEIDKKKRVYYERIQIVGNNKTRDKVIRRELRVVEGELYNAADMNKSRDRLKRTGFLKEVEFTTSRGSAEDKTNLDVKVEEEKTGALSFGVGYSSVQSLVGSISVSDRNLFGLGYNALIKFSLGAKDQEARISFTDPYFLESLYSAGIDLYHEKITTFETYSYKITGADIRIGKELSNIFHIDTMYKLERVNVYNPQAEVHLDDNGKPIPFKTYPLPGGEIITNPETFNPPYLQEELGNRTTSAISITPSIDNRDDYFNPRHGGQHSLFIQNTGAFLGGTSSFFKTILSTSWFFPLPWNTTLNLRSKAGIILPYGGSSKVPLNEKFYMGGLDTVRGFEYGKGGPTDPLTGEALGALKMFVFNTEWIFPLFREIGLKGALFFDIGQAWGKKPNSVAQIIETGKIIDLNNEAFYNRIYSNYHQGGIKMGAGPGIRWQSPFGPIHIDIGVNLFPKNGESRTKIEFTGGTVF